LERKLSLLEEALEKYAEVPVQEAKAPVVQSVDMLSRSIGITPMRFNVKLKRIGMRYLTILPSLSRLPIY